MLERETQGLSRKSKQKELLLKAEEKQRHAMQKDFESKECERSAREGEKNVHRLCNRLLANERMRSEVKRQKKEEEQKVFEMGEQLKKLKIESANFQALARKLRNEEAEADAAYFRLEEEADRAKILANHAKNVARQLESETKHKM